MDTAKQEKLGTLQTLQGIVQNRPNDGVLIGVLKAIETEFTRRGLIQQNSGHPLWFAAETERNVFLWRNGLSLENQFEFEFWVRPQALIEKRLNQLKTSDTFNPFLSSLAQDGSDLRSLGEYRSCLEELYDRFEVIASHANALSQASSIVMDEIRATRRQIVVLPVDKKRSMMEQCDHGTLPKP